MDELSSLTAIDEKMAAMRIKNLKLLQRHQEIEEDRQLAVLSGATMRGATKNRPRLITNPPNAQETSNERMYRPPIRRKFENDRNDNQPQRAQRVDYTRLKRDRAREITNQNPPTNPELHEYAFHYQNNDTDETTHARKLVIVNNKAGRIGSGRFNQQQQQQQQQQQRIQDKGQRKREERMRRCVGQTNGHTGGTNEFHLDLPPVPMWQNSPMHLQLIPTNLTGLDHLINTSGDQIDQSAFIHNFVYQSPGQGVSFNGNGPVYFAHPPPTPQTHFHQYNSARQQFHLPPYQTSPIFQPPIPTSNENSSVDLPPRFRHVKSSEQRPISGDFERLHNTYHSSRFQLRPQSFYDSSRTTNNINNNRHQRNINNINNNNPSLPLSAYINTDESFKTRRRLAQQRPYYQDKHQFPLSSYDPRQYGFNNNTQKRNDTNDPQSMNNNSNNNDGDVDLIEEWWEDNNTTELTGTDPKTTTATTVDDSGNSSLSTSMNLKDEFANPPSDVSTSDSNIIESLDKLQQQLKYEEAVDERLASSKESTPYDTAHFLQWAKEKFREELAGRLTAQEIEQHDAVTTDDDEQPANKMDALEDDLNEKLTISKS